MSEIDELQAELKENRTFMYECDADTLFAMYNTALDMVQAALDECSAAPAELDTGRHQGKREMADRIIGAMHGAMEAK